MTLKRPKRRKRKPSKDAVLRLILKKLMKDLREKEGFYWIVITTICYLRTNWQLKNKMYQQDSARIKVCFVTSF